MRVLGIDPGLSGALALIDDRIGVVIVRDMPTLPAGKGKRLICPVSVAEIVEAFDPDVAYVERVHAMPKQGVVSIFTFGLGCGIVQGVLGAKHVPFHLITPQEWKRALRLGADKKAARAAASRLFPVQAVELFSRVRDDGRAEAALIAYFGLSRARP